MNEYFVRIIPLPRTVMGFVLPNDDDTYSIYINALLSDEMRRSTLEHEVDHIIRGDLYSDEAASVIEGYAQ